MTYLSTDPKAGKPLAGYLSMDPTSGEPTQVSSVADPPPPTPPPPPMAQPEASGFLETVWNTGKGYIDPRTITEMANHGLIDPAIEMSRQGAEQGGLGGAAKMLMAPLAGPAKYVSDRVGHMGQVVPALMETRGATSGPSPVVHALDELGNAIPGVMSAKSVLEDVYSAPTWQEKLARATGHVGGLVAGGKLLEHAPAAPSAVVRGVKSVPAVATTVSKGAVKVAQKVGPELVGGAVGTAVSGGLGGGLVGAVAARVLRPKVAAWLKKRFGMSDAKAATISEKMSDGAIEKIARENLPPEAMIPEGAMRPSQTSTTYLGRSEPPPPPPPPGGSPGSYAADQPPQPAWTPQAPGTVESQLAATGTTPAIDSWATPLKPMPETPPETAPQARGGVPEAPPAPKVSVMPEVVSAVDEALGKGIKPDVIRQHLVETAGLSAEEASAGVQAGIAAREARRQGHIQRGREAKAAREAPPAAPPEVPPAPAGASGARSTLAEYYNIDPEKSVDLPGFVGTHPELGLPMNDKGQVLVRNVHEFNQTPGARPNGETVWRNPETNPFGNPSVLEVKKMLEARGQKPGPIEAPGDLWDAETLARKADQDAIDAAAFNERQLTNYRIARGDYVPEEILEGHASLSKFDPAVDTAREALAKRMKKEDIATLLAEKHDIGPKLAEEIYREAKDFKTTTNRGAGWLPDKPPSGGGGRGGRGERPVDRMKVPADTPALAEIRRRSLEEIEGKGESPVAPKERMALQDMEPPATQFAGNKIITQAMADAADVVLAKAAKRIGKSTPNVNKLVDPEAFGAFVTKGLAHFERGARNFADWSKAMLEEHGPTIRPHLKKMWAEVQTQAKEYGIHKGPEVGRVEPRIPTSKGESLLPAGEINLASIEASKDHVAAIKNVISKYDIIPKGMQRGAILNHFKTVVADNLVHLWEKMPEVQRKRAMNWYVGANKIAIDMAEKYGASLDQTSGVLAVFSPQKDWFQNVSLAHRLIKIVHDEWKTPWSKEMTANLDAYRKASGSEAEISERNYLSAIGDRLEGKTMAEMTQRERALFARFFDETYHPRGYREVTPEGGFNDFVRSGSGKVTPVAWPGFATIEKALSILDNGTKENISRAVGNEHKVRSFHNSILDPTNPAGDVVIDTHAVAAALLKALSGKSIEVAHNFGAGGGSSLTGASGTYGLLADAYREAAARLGVRPGQMQSVTWEAIRALVPKAQKNAMRVGIDKVWGDFKEGKISVEERNAQLFGDRKIDLQHLQGPEGTKFSEGGRSFNEKKKVNTLRSPKEWSQSITTNISAYTKSLPGFDKMNDLARAGDKLAMKTLQNFAINGLRSVFPKGSGVTIVPTRTVGMYFKDFEPLISAVLKFKNSKFDQVVSALDDYRKQFKQTDVHVLQTVYKQPDGHIPKIGETFEDGSFVVPKYTIELTKNLTNEEIQLIAEKADLAGFNVGDKVLETYMIELPDEVTRDAFGSKVEAAIEELESRGVFSKVRAKTARFRTRSDRGTPSGVEAGSGDLGSPVLKATVKESLKKAEKYVPSPKTLSELAGVKK